MSGCCTLVVNCRLCTLLYSGSVSTVLCYLFNRGDDPPAGPPGPDYILVREVQYSVVVVEYSVVVVEYSVVVVEYSVVVVEY